MDARRGLGEDYYTNFRKGDPYVKVDQGFARLPGAGYAALHPELKDTNLEGHPDIHKHVPRDHFIEENRHGCPKRLD